MMEAIAVASTSTDDGGGAMTVVARESGAWCGDAVTRELAWGALAALAAAEEELKAKEEEEQEGEGERDGVGSSAATVLPSGEDQATALTPYVCPTHFAVHAPPAGVNVCAPAGHHHLTRSLPPSHLLTSSSSAAISSTLTFSLSSWYTRSPATRLSCVCRGWDGGKGDRGGCELLILSTQMMSTLFVFETYIFTHCPGRHLQSFPAPSGMPRLIALATSSSARCPFVPFSIASERL